jgi:hypothetical protein
VPALAEYQRILNGFAGRKPGESARMMERLLEAHPDFALAPEAMLWLANLDAREGRLDEAERRYLEVERRFPSSEPWANARKGRGDLALRRGHPLAARALYRSILDAGTGAASADAARMGLKRATTALRRMFIFWICLAWLTAFLGALLVTARPLRIPRPVPVEILFYLPIAVLFVICGATENRSIAIATAVMAAGGAVLLAVSSLATVRRMARGPIGVRERLLRVAALALSAVALAYVALYLGSDYNTDMFDLVMETIHTGPER